jgi:4-hydroxybenzoyl-CoA reductase subunit alpha
MGRIRLVKPAMGGGFGGRPRRRPRLLRGPLAEDGAPGPDGVLQGAYPAGAGTPDHPAEDGVKKDGTITAVHADILLDGGAYTSYGIITAYYSGVMLTTPYRIPAFRFDGRRVSTNLPACGAMRGNGTPQPRFAFESQLDLLAADLGMDALELRRRNALRRTAGRSTTCDHVVR